MNVQHINVKIFAQQPVMIDLGDAIPVFHRWIQDQSLMNCSSMSPTTGMCPRVLA